jgi:ubiquinone/menaquinone biosynthesis C-methylase UbiE
VFDRFVELGDLRGQRVLEIGCGPGRLAAALAERAVARVWAVDASAAMVEEARANVPASVGVKVGTAEALPFRDGWFDRAVMRMTVHLLDRPRAFAELRRVLAPGGRLVIGTPNPDKFSSHRYAAYFPSFALIDAARFPSAAELDSELRGAGFDEVEITRHDHVLESTREQDLAKIRGRAFSTFDLIPEDEYREGLARAERELPERMRHHHEWLIAVAFRRGS